MSKVATFVLSIILSVGAVASAQEVSAPQSRGDSYLVVPVKSELSVYVPKTDPLMEARDRERQQAIDQADKCREWAGLAYDIGWPAEEIPRLLNIMHRESRCLPDACSESDSGRVCRDWGLMQINEYSWRTTIQKQGYQMADMWDPEHNLRFALWLYNYSLDRNGDGWQPWAIPDKQT